MPTKPPLIAWRAKNLNSWLSFYDPKNIPKFKGFGGKTRKASKSKATSKTNKTQKCEKVVEIKKWFRREKLETMTNRQKKGFAKKTMKNCMKNPAMNKMNINEYEKLHKSFNKKLYERFPN